MKKLLIFILAMFCIALVYANTANDKLNQLLRNTHTMQADFTQEILNKSSQLVRNTQGHMALQRPGKFRWEVTSPVAQLIIANGKKLWIYDKDLEQVTIRTLVSSAGETPALLLSDEKLILDKEFYVKEVRQNSSAEVFFLLPKDKSSLFASVRISFVNKVIDEMRLQDHLGQTIVIKFKNIKANIALSPSLFNFEPPANIDVIDETRKK